MPPDDGDDVRLAAHLRTLKRIHLGLAHDLRAPLNAALLNVELLRRTLAGGAVDDAEAAERCAGWLGIVEKELGRLRQALEALLVEFAPGSGVQDRFDLREILVHLGRLLAAQARQQRILLEVTVPEAPVTVVADRGALRQALLSYAVAALEGARPGDAVRLELTSGAGEAVASIAAGGAAPAADGTNAKEVSSGLAPPDAVARALLKEQGGNVRFIDGEHGRTEVVVPLAGGHGPATGA